MLKRIKIEGLRGVSTAVDLQFAQPDGRPGSGLTILVGANNAGKSTIIEALRLVSVRNPTPLAERRRNKAHDDRVDIRLELMTGDFRELRTVDSGGSQTEWSVDGVDHETVRIFAVPAHRSFSTSFGDPGYVITRGDFAGAGLPAQMRNPIYEGFTNRLFTVNRDPVKRAEFGRLLARVLGYEPDWTIDLDENGNHFLLFRWGGVEGVRHQHSGEGIGDGLLSLFVVLDALHDSEEGSTVVIDEPELSLHPQFQRRLAELLAEMARDRQIICATHSPYFVRWHDLGSGASVCRVYKSATGTTIAIPSAEVIDAILRLGQGNRNNPHILGLEAAEVFLLEGGVILVEGQEDVVVMRQILADRGLDLNGTFFGWGVGGADNMKAVCRLLQALGYGSVLGILDGNKRAVAEELSEMFPGYHFEVIPADDIRTKAPREATAGVDGLVENGVIRPELEPQFAELLTRGAAYLKGGGEPAVIL